MKIKTNEPYVINYNSSECSDDAIDRFMKDHKMKKHIQVKVAGLCERIYYRTAGNDYFIQSKFCTLNDDMSGTVEFVIARV